MSEWMRHCLSIKTWESESKGQWWSRNWTPGFSFVYVWSVEYQCDINTHWEITFLQKIKFSVFVMSIVHLHLNLITLETSQRRLWKLTVHESNGVLDLTLKNWDVLLSSSSKQKNVQQVTSAVFIPFICGSIWKDPTHCTRLLVFTLMINHVKGFRGDICLKNRFFLTVG